MGPLEEKSVFILREANAIFKNPIALWSGGKDSTALISLCRTAFAGAVPFPVVHIDNGIDFPETYEFRDRLVRDWELNLVTVHSQIKPDGISGISCCGQNKTEALKELVASENIDAIIVGIRSDEHGIRAKERVFSPRDNEWQWNYREQPLEAWGYTSVTTGASHHRVHPLLEWRERDVWQYIKEQDMPVHPLYFSNGKNRYRSLGCSRCTVGIPSQAQTIEDIIGELATAQTSERSGRAQDKEEEAVMERLRALGYM